MLASPLLPRLWTLWVQGMGLSHCLHFQTQALLLQPRCQKLVQNSYLAASRCIRESGHFTFLNNFQEIFQHIRLWISWEGKKKVLYIQVFVEVETLCKESKPMVRTWWWDPGFRLLLPPSGPPGYRSTAAPTEGKSVLMKKFSRSNLIIQSWRALTGCFLSSSTVRNGMSIFWANVFWNPHLYNSFAKL